MLCIRWIHYFLIGNTLSLTLACSSGGVSAGRALPSPSCPTFQEHRIPGSKLSAGDPCNLTFRAQSVAMHALSMLRCSPSVDSLHAYRIQCNYLSFLLTAAVCSPSRSRRLDTLRGQLKHAMLGRRPDTCVAPGSLSFTLSLFLLTLSRLIHCCEMPIFWHYVSTKFSHYQIEIFYVNCSNLFYLFSLYI
jgi:hypothetical protein